MEDLKLKKRQIIVFPDGAGLIIVKLLKKYGLEESQNMITKKMIDTKDYKKKIEILEELPGRKIAKILRGAANGEIASGDLASTLVGHLNIPIKKAEELSTDLEEEILALGKKEYIEEEETPVTKKPTPPIIKPLKPASSEKTSPIKEIKPPQKTDVYRETFE